MRVIERNCEIPHEGPFCDLMWSDPEEIETWAVSPRGAGWLFGSRVTSEVNILCTLYDCRTSLILLFFAVLSFYGCCYKDLFSFFSLITLTILISFAGPTNLFKKVLNTCFKIKAL